MELIREIQDNLEKQKKLKEQQTQEILQWLEEESAKPTIGLNEIGGLVGQVGDERAAQSKAGERDWVRGMARDTQDPLKEPTAKPIFLMGKQVPPQAVKLTADGRAIVRARGKTFEYQVEEHEDKIVLK